jgi:hypothetical protein
MSNSMFATMLFLHVTNANTQKVVSIIKFIFPFLFQTLLLPLSCLFGLSFAYPYPVAVAFPDQIHNPHKGYEPPHKSGYEPVHKGHGDEHVGRVKMQVCDL